MIMFGSPHATPYVSCILLWVAPYTSYFPPIGGVSGWRQHQGGICSAGRPCRLHATLNLTLVYDQIPNPNLMEHLLVEFEFCCQQCFSHSKKASVRK